MNERVSEFLLAALQTEQGGVEVYETALRCAQNEELAEEWQKYLDETKTHVERYTELITELGLDPEGEAPGRDLVRQSGRSLVALMEAALETADPEGAELVAAECIVQAEEKCNLNWDLVGELGKKTKGEPGKLLRAAHEETEEEEKEHLYHTRGWARELWIKRLGMPAVIPPPEEEKDVKTAIGAERARMARKELL